ncbi:polysaccharide biosynthesis protein [Ochrobactrum cytisi]|nr:polysaccharide biosynthesis protein [Brucella cytisi]
MILLAGLTVRNDENPHGDIAIETTGIREGEKMYEELFYDPAQAKPTRHPKIMRLLLGARRLRLMFRPASLHFVLRWKVAISMRFARFCSTL